MELRIKELCQIKGTTQKELAIKIGVTEMTLSRASKGNTSLQLLEKIAENLGVEIWELFTESRDDRDFMAIIKNKSDYFTATTISELDRIVAKIKGEGFIPDHKNVRGKEYFK